MLPAEFAGARVLDVGTFDARSSLSTAVPSG
jgi:hypothetical protein